MTTTEIHYLGGPTRADRFAQNPGLDERNRYIIECRIAAYAAIDGPRVGDWVDFPGGEKRRISHIWAWADNEGDPITARSIQTSKGGSYHLGNGYVSMSGSLYVGVPASTLHLTDEIRSADAWIFHHDHYTAGNAVHFTAPFRVFTCDQEAPSS